jgi:hypothetical protein
MVRDSAERSLAVVRRFMGAAGIEHRAERAELLHEDFVVYAAGGLPYSGNYRGAPGFFELLTKISDALTLQPGPVTLDALGEHIVVARFRLTLISRASGGIAETGLVELYTVRGGLIAELDVYYKDPSVVTELLAQ